MKGFVLIGFAGFVCLVSACKDENDSSAESKMEDYEGRGSKACQTWQYSMCEFAFEQCGMTEGQRAVCEEQYGSIVCLSDEAALACAEDLQSADSCDAVIYSACHPSVIADPKPAIDGCIAMNRVQCERWIECDNSETMEECMEYLSSTIDCNAAIGLTALYEECIEEIKIQTCTFQLPTVCREVILSL